MNIVQISEQLKDVPDQFLMQEIQNPTGAYPSYLVVSELTRRKRMREGAVKQEPTTSVAEDLIGISGTPQAGQSTLGAAQQMMAQQPMPEMGMNVPQMSMNAPETGTPMMATGGLVAFEHGGPIRAFDGMFVGDYTQDRQEIPRGEFIKELSLSELQEYNRTGKVPERLYGRFGKEPAIATSDPFLYFQPTTVATPDAYPPAKGNRQVPLSAIKSPVATGATPAQPQGQPLAPGGLGAFKLPAPPPAPATLQSLSEQEISRIREAGIKEREEMIPDRISKLLEERILRKTEQLQKDKDMSFNEALFAAGAAILAAPGGGGMKWAGEGLKAFGQTLAEGKKDMRKSQDLLDQANIDLANAQMLRDQGRLDAADKAERKAQDRIDRSNALLTTQASLTRQQWQDQITAAKLPYEIAESQSKAAYQSAYANLLRSGGAGAATAAAKAANEGFDIGKMNMAKVQAESDLIAMGIKKPTQEQIIEQAAVYYPAIKNIPMPKPQIRGLDAPATLP